MKEVPQPVEVINKGRWMMEVQANLAAMQEQLLALQIQILNIQQTIKHAEELEDNGYKVTYKIEGGNYGYEAQEKPKMGFVK